MQKIINYITYYHKKSVADLTAGKESTKSQLKSLLEGNGVVLIKNFFDRDKAKTLGNELNILASKAKRELGSSSYMECDEWFAQCDLSKFKDYNEISKAGKPVLNIRSKIEGIDDAGFIDFFGVENLYRHSVLFNEAVTSIKNSLIPEIIEELSGYKRQQMNLYLNEGIVQTRGPHIDNLHGSFKCFLYLSDVDCMSIGPYTYVPCSHKGSLMKKINARYNKLIGMPKVTDIPVPKLLPLAFLGEAGTLIVSCQSGIHGGAQQRPDASRTVLVDNYY